MKSNAKLQSKANIQSLLEPSSLRQGDIISYPFYGNINLHLIFFRYGCIPLSCKILDFENCIFKPGSELEKNSSSRSSIGSSRVEL
jgi:hypothetical protein